MTRAEAEAEARAREAGQARRSIGVTLSSLSSDDSRIDRVVDPPNLDTLGSSTSRAVTTQVGWHNGTPSERGACRQGLKSSSCVRIEVQFQRNFELNRAIYIHFLIIATIN